MFPMQSIGEFNHVKIKQKRFPDDFYNICILDCGLITRGKADIPADQSSKPEAGLSKLTGMNQSLISQYANGIKQPGRKQVARIEAAIHEFARDLMKVRL